MNKNIVLAAAGASTGWTIETVDDTGIVTPSKLFENSLFFAFDSTETILYVGSSTTISQYTLSAAKDIESAVFTGKTFAISNYTEIGELQSEGLFNSSVAKLHFSSSGTKMFVSTAYRVYTFVLSTAWDISTAAPETTFVPSTSPIIFENANEASLTLSSDETKAYTISLDLISGFTYQVKIHRYNLSVAGDISSATYVSTTDLGTLTYTSSSFTTPRIVIGDNGLNFYVHQIISSNNTILHYTLSVAWDISTATLANTFSNSSIRNSFILSPDGTSLVFINTLSELVSYTLSTPWQLSTTTLSGSTSLANFPDAITPANSVTNISFNANGTKVIAFSTNFIAEYSLPTPYIAASVTVARTTEYKKFKLSNNTYFIVCQNGQKIIGFGKNSTTTSSFPNYYYLLNLSAAYDTSNIAMNGSGSYHYIHNLCNSQFYSVVQSDFTSSSSVASIELGDFAPDGSALYLYKYMRGVVGNVYRLAINKVSLTTPWNLSTVDFIDSAPAIFSPFENSPTGIRFSESGDKFYIVGAGYDHVSQYSLSKPWSVSSANLSNIGFDSARYSIAVTSADVKFNSDGTKMYTISSTTDLIYEYNLSVAWDITTATAGATFSVASQDTTPTGLFWRPNGLSLYVVGSSADNVHEYTLTSAWNLGTASLTRSFSVSGADATPQTVEFNPDGTRMFIVGTSSDTIRQYNLSTAWNISTAVLQTTPTLAVGTQNTAPAGLFFKSDGTKIYMVGSTTGRIHEYTLSTAWNLATASNTYNSQILSQAVRTTVAPNFTGITFSSDGTKVFLSTSSAFNICSINLSTAWDLSTAVFRNGLYIDVESAPTDIHFKPDGTRMFVIGSTADAIRTYALSTPWDITSGVLASDTFNVGSQDTAPAAIFFKPDGTKLYMLGGTNQNVHEYNLATAWQVASATLVTSGTAIGAGVNGLWFSSDGTKMHVVSSSNVYEYTLGTPWSISTASLTTTSSNILPNATTTSGIAFDTTGKIIYFIDSTSDAVSTRFLPTAYSVSNYSTVSDFTLLTPPSTSSWFWQPGSKIFINSDQSSLYAHYQNSSSSKTLYKYNFSSPGVIATLSSTANQTSVLTLSYPNLVFDINTSADDSEMFSLQSNGVLSAATFGTPNDLTTLFIDYQGAKYVAPYPTSASKTRFSADGTKAFVLGSSIVYSYTLSSAWEIDTAVYDNISFNLSSSSTIAFKSDGTKMYSVASTGTISEYSLSTAWNLSTATFVASSTILPYTGASIQDIAISTDGTTVVLFIGESTGSVNSVFQFGMATPWSVATLTSSISYPYILQNILSQNVNATAGLTFSSDGTKLYSVDTVSKIVYQYTMSTAYDITTAVYDNKFCQLEYVGTPGVVRFSSDGTKLFIIDTGKIIFRASLSTAWDISTVSFSGIITSPSASTTVSVDTDYAGIELAANGSKMYIVGKNNKRIYQYSLSTAYNTSTASYDGVSFDLSTIISNDLFDTLPFCFSDNGSRLVIANNTVFGTSNIMLYEYTLSTAWNLATASLAGSASMETVQGFSTTSCFLTGIRWYDLFFFTAYANVSSNTTFSSISRRRVNRTSQSILAATGGSTGSGSFVTLPSSVFPSQIVARLYNNTSPQEGAIITPNFYNSRAINIYSIQYRYITQDAIKGTAGAFNGSRFYFLEQSGKITEIPISPSYRYDTISWTNYQTAGTNIIGLPDITNTESYSLNFKPDGNKLYVLGTTAGFASLYEYNLGTSWDIDTASYSNVVSVVSPPSSSYGAYDFGIDSSGENFYIGYGSSTPGLIRKHIIRKYTTASPWSTTSLNLTDSISTWPTIDGTNGTIGAITLPPDGSTLYILGRVSKNIGKYDLTTPYNLTSAYFDITNGEVLPFTGTTSIGGSISPDGTKMHILQSSSPKIVYEFDLGSTWNIDTFTQSDNIYSIGTWLGNPQGIEFSSSDGNNMYITDLYAGIFQTKIG